MSLTPFTVSSGSGVYVSPFVTSMTPDGFINISGETVSAVEVTGIHRAFDISLNEIADIKTLLEAFTVSSANGGTYLDARLGQMNYHFSSVAMAGENNFKTLIRRCLSEATDLNEEIIDQFLARQLRVAFLTAFPTLAAGLNMGLVGAEADVAALDALGQGPSQLASNGGSIGPALEASTDATVTVSTTNHFTGFSVDVLTDVSEGAASLWRNHDEASALRRSVMLTQLPRANLQKYMQANTLFDVSDGDLSTPETGVADGWAYLPLPTTALPLVENDTLVFIFDIDVAVADNAQDVANANNSNALGTNETAGSSLASGAGAGAYGGAGVYGDSTFSLNMANRRIALRLKCKTDEGTNGEPFPVIRTGVTEGLAASNLRAAKGPYAGAGTNADSTSTTVGTANP
jgi:hypothetical protein